MPQLNSWIGSENTAVIHHWQYPVRTDQLWDALTQGAQLSKWLGEPRLANFEVGQLVEIQHATDYWCTCLIQRCDPAKLLIMTWKFPDENLSMLELRLAGNSTGTKLSLIHSQLSDQATNYFTGWQTHLQYLEDLLCGSPRPMADFWSLYEKLAAETKQVN
ncbi:SRPBCC domain-containing protein [Glutamicibacter sp.]|jgi:Uncharacterized conserved protein|uniref:SRPBCC domain-containing protein n=1 Tax=Glutamicibacter sp. TaxID=1931995 RepID=UPI002B4767BE|nr:SRPBCC domain-containing protein [Glutamicibacter sp.]HJX79781.1 SRPBCC domain-containing protein [Glutamicibacter sp.]